MNIRERLNERMERLISNGTLEAKHRFTVKELEVFEELAGLLYESRETAMVVCMGMHWLEQFYHIDQLKGDKQ